MNLKEERVGRIGLSWQIPLMRTAYCGNPEETSHDNSVVVTCVNCEPTQWRGGRSPLFDAILNRPSSWMIPCTHRMSLFKGMDESVNGNWNGHGSLLGRGIGLQIGPPILITVHANFGVYTVSNVSKGTWFSVHSQLCTAYVVCHGRENARFSFPRSNLKRFSPSSLSFGSIIS